MASTVVKLGQNGRLVIPVEYRSALGVSEGDELLVRFVDGELRVTTRAEAIRLAQAAVRKYVPAGHSLSDELLEERRAEAAPENHGS